MNSEAKPARRKGMWMGGTVDSKTHPTKRPQWLDGNAGKRSYRLISIIRINSLAC